MNYDRNIYETAENIIQNRRIKAEREQHARQNEVERAIPEIKEINRHLSLTVIEISKLALTNDANFDTKIKEIKEKNLQGQTLIKQMLASHSLPEDYLDVHYHCKICNDRGVSSSGYCKCFSDVLKTLSVEQLNRFANLPYCDFEHFSLEFYRGKKSSNGKDCLEIMKKNLEICIKYAEDFTIKSPNLFFYGLTGLGKTHLSLSIAKVVAEQKFNVVYGSVVNLLSKVEAEHFGNTERITIDLLNNVDLLILDDLGSEFYTSFNESTLYEIINTRINLSLPTIVNSNLTVAELQKKYNDRIISRIFGSYELLQLVGTDIRQLKKHFNL